MILILVITLKTLVKINLKFLNESIYSLLNSCSISQELFKTL